MTEHATSSTSRPVRPLRDDSGSYAADQGELSQPTSYGVGPNFDHDWRFWGDDPYLICDCGAIRDALTGNTVKEGRGHA